MPYKDREARNAYQRERNKRPDVAEKRREAQRKRYNSDEEYRNRIREFCAKYYEENKEEVLENAKERYEENREEIIAKNNAYARTPDGKVVQKRYRENNKEKINQRISEWRQSEAGRECSIRWREQNRDAINAYARSKRDNDPTHALACRARSRTRDALFRAGAEKDKRTFDFIGCSPEYFKNHIESLFTDGMDWDNRSDWHLDHIIPVSLFNLLDSEECDLAFHYSNVQPMWARDNQIKNNRLFVDGVLITDKETILAMAMEQKNRTNTDG